MLPRPARLTRGADIERVVRRGLRRRVPPLDLRVGPSGPRPRIAFIVSTKVSKRATVRNLLRRRLRALVSEDLAQLAPRDYVILTSAPAATLTYQQLRDCFHRLIATAYDRHHA